MVTVVKGNICDAKEGIIAHQVNCEGVMGSGVALALRDKWPIIHKDYFVLCQELGPDKLLGSVDLVFVDTDKYVANLFGQASFGPGCHTRYDKLEEALRALKKSAEVLGHDVAIPYRIGCGLGGGDWSIVNRIIHAIFEDDDVNVVLYRYDE